MHISKKSVYPKEEFKHYETFLQLWEREKKMVWISISDPVKKSIFSDSIPIEELHMENYK